MVENPHRPLLPSLPTRPSWAVRVWNLTPPEPPGATRNLYRGTSLVRNTPPTRTLYDPTVGLYLGSDGGPGGGSISHEQDIPAGGEFKGSERSEFKMQHLREWLHLPHS